MIQVECVQSAEMLETLRNDWDRLSDGFAMRRFSWLMSWWHAHRASHQLNVLVAYRGENVCGIMPLAQTKSVWTGCTLVFMGSGKVCSDNMGILCEPTETVSVADAFAAWLGQSQDCCRWDHLNLDGVRDDNAGMKRFGEALVEFGMRIERKSSPNCWSASLEGGYEEYKRRLSKRARKILRDAETLWKSGRCEFEVAETLDRAMVFVREIEQLHQLRWEKRGIEGCFAAPCFRDFLDKAIQAMWNDPWRPTEGSHQHVPVSKTEAGRIHVAMLRIDGKPAAGTICIRDRDSLDMYLTGMSLEFEDLRPGWQLNSHCIQFAIEIGCKHLDFLRGDEGYKERLGGLPSVQHRWLIASPRWTSQLRNRAYRTAVGLKAWWQPQPTVAIHNAGLLSENAS